MTSPCAIEPTKTNTTSKEDDLSNDLNATPGSSTGISLSGPLYDKLKWLAQLGLPALGTLYFTIASVWGLPGGEKVLGTLAALCTFLGVVLGLSKRSYDASDAKYDGAVVETGDPEAPHTLVFNAPLEELGQQKQIVLKTPGS